MPIRKEKWTLLRVTVTLEASRATHRLDSIFVSPGGVFVPAALSLEPGQPAVVRFAVDGRAIVAHTEARRVLSADEAAARGIEPKTAGIELRLVRMEGDGSQILAEHIRKIIMESGGPGA